MTFSTYLPYNNPRALTKTRILSHQISPSIGYCGAHAEASAAETRLGCGGWHDDGFRTFRTLGQKNPSACGAIAVLAGTMTGAQPQDCVLFQLHFLLNPESK